MSTGPPDPADAWPALPLEEWQDTCATLHLWLQVVGKVRLALSPWVNHSWHATLYVTASGLTTSPIPYRDRAFQIYLDLLRHQLRVEVSDGRSGGFDLEPRSVADFHQRLLEELAGLGLHVSIHGTPNEIADPIPFAEDELHRSYDRHRVGLFFRALVQVHRVFSEFRVRFIGKCSPVHLFWGALDLAVTRFSGRAGPVHPGGVTGLPDAVTREAYSHELSSCGFWPGGGPIPYPAFYSYAYPEPEGFRDAAVRPREAFYSHELGEFILPWEAVRAAPSPDTLLLDFLQSTYEAAADLGRWDRPSLEGDRDPRGKG